MSEIRKPMLWTKTLEALQESVEPYDYMHWIRPIECDAVDESRHEIVLSVPDDSHGRWVEENFLGSIRETLNLFTDDDYNIRLRTEEGLSKGLSSELSRKPKTRSHQVDSAPKLIDRYRFDTYVQGPTNRFAMTAARAVAEHPGTRYNPLFLYGGVGLGKTHLLHAIGHHTQRMNRSARVVYATSETFVNDLIDAIRNDKMGLFRRRYRDNCDVLLIDDIQFIAGKDRTQEEFFHMFNTLHSSRKQIVMTSDRVPQSIPDMENRLRSRMQWGLIANINPPGFETRVAILKQKADSDGIELSDDVAMMLAENISRNVRDLEGALMRLEATAGVFGLPITRALAEDVLEDLLTERVRHISPEKILKTVADDFRVTLGDLKGPRRHRAITVPRQVAMYLIRELTKDSLPQIGTYFGGRDHTTVINAIKRINERQSADPVLRTRINNLMLSLNGG